MKKWTELLINSPRPLLSDGAWGTFLYEMGLSAGESADEWCLSHPSEVENIARAYIEAGSDIVETNSFGTSILRLAEYSLEDKCYEMNKRAVELSRSAAGDSKLVFASMGPSGKLLMMEDVKENEMLESFKIQAMAFQAGGADAVCVETMSDLKEADLAIRSVLENTHLPVISTFTYDKTKQGEFRTMMGVSPKEAVEMALAAGADIVGSNCGNGIEGMVEIAAEIRSSFPRVPLMIQANAGLPKLVNGKQVYDESPDIMASFIPKLISLNVNIIGGCCGTGPDHIRAFRREIDRKF